MNVEQHVEEQSLESVRSIAELLWRVYDLQMTTPIWSEEARQRSWRLLYRAERWQKLVDHLEQQHASRGNVA
jgi:hypothetical protein